MALAFSTVKHDVDPRFGITMWRAAPSSQESTHHLVVPDARADILVVIDRRSRDVLRTVYTGFDLVSYEVRVERNELFLGVQFSAATCTAAHDILASDRLTTALVDRLVEGRRRGVVYAGDELPSRLTEHYDPLLDRVMRSLEKRPHRDEIARNAGLFGLSLRTLERRVRRVTGVTPLDFVRIARFRAFVALARRGGPDADLALRAGYSDQAHMCREVKSISSMTPYRLVDRLGSGRPKSAQHR